MSQTLSQVLKEEITRLSRKEIKRNTVQTKKTVAQHRHDLAEMKRLVSDLLRRVAHLESQESKRIAEPADESLAEGSRFSPRWLQSHREKLGFSAADYGRLVGVTAQTIYSWEQERSKPRRSQLANLVAVRGIGKREALRRLELIAKS